MIQSLWTKKRQTLSASAALAVLTVQVALGSLIPASFISMAQAATRPSCNSQLATIWVNSDNNHIMNSTTDTGVNFTGTLTGTNGNNVIVGTSLADTINADSGNDTVCGGDGNDTINGGNDNDTLFGEGGNDIINGNNHNDTINGGPGTDTLNGNNHDDTIIAGDGEGDIVNGGNQNDVCSVDMTLDTVSGCATTTFASSSSSSASSAQVSSSSSSVVVPSSSSLSSSSIAVSSSVASSSDASSSSSIVLSSSDASSSSSVDASSSSSVVAVSSATSSSVDSSSSESSSSSSIDSSSSSSVASIASSSSSVASSSSSAAVITACVATDLVAYWKLDENAGSLAFDQVSITHLGVLTNGSTWVAGTPTVNPNVSALSFDGTDDAVVTGAVSDFAFDTDEFTVSLFAKPTSGNRSVLGNFSPLLRGWGLYFYSNNTINFFGYGDTGTNDAAKPATVLDGNWHHIVGVYKRAGASLTIETYVDGALIGTNTANVGDIGSSSPLFLGKYLLQPTYAGSLDDIRIYERALTGSEVTQLAADCGSASAGSSSSATSSAASTSSVSSSTTSTASTNSSASAASSQQATVAGFNQDGGASGGLGDSGSYRGNRTTEIGGVANYLAGIFFGGGTSTRGLPTGGFGGIAPGGFGGANTVPFTEGEKRLICTMQRSRSLTGTVEGWLVEHLSDLMNRSEGMIERALADATFCDDYVVKTTAAPKTVSALPFPVDSKGVPVASNPLWNKCIRGLMVLPADITNNADKDEDGKAKTCADYHTQESWFHPDLQAYFTWDRSTGTLEVPKGYTVDKTEYAVTLQ